MKNYNTYIKENINDKLSNQKRFIPGEYVYSFAFKKIYKIVSTTDREIRIVDKNGFVGDFLIKDFIPEIEYQSNKYNL